MGIALHLLNFQVILLYMLMLNDVSTLFAGIVFTADQ
jgi:hypothetical protein